LALQTDEFIQEYIAATGLPAYTPQTITGAADLWRAVRAVRDQQYAINNGEHYQDVGAVGVPIVDPDGRVTKAISLAYPQHLVDSGRLQVDALVSLAREIAQDIASLMV
jgi:DNA-binding IclR family transcriptional regulator